MMMTAAYSVNDTIVAQGTPAGRGALGVLRISGEDAWALARRLVPDLPVRAEAQRAYVTRVHLPLPAGGKFKTTAVVLLWRGPRSYTGEDMAELSLHGNPALLQLALSVCMVNGARLAEPGEFTYRAYLNGKLDLAQAEAVQELVAAAGVQALRLAATALLGATSKLLTAWDAKLAALLAEIEVFHDYAGDDLDASLSCSAVGQREPLFAELEALVSAMSGALAASKSTAPLREGVTVALCGPPNAGKSTLFNALLGHSRALTSPLPGTTRDYITATVEIEGLRITFVDTAGVRESAGEIETAGVELAREWGQSADIVLWLDNAASAPAGPAVNGAWQVMTHCDQLPQWPQAVTGTFHVSGTTGQGVDHLRDSILRSITQHVSASALGAFTARQSGFIEASRSCCEQALMAMRDGIPLDAVAVDLNQARQALQHIGRPPDRESVLTQVFSRFCVGK